MWRTNHPADSETRANVTAGTIVASLRALQLPTRAPVDRCAGHIHPAPVLSLSQYHTVTSHQSCITTVCTTSIPTAQYCNNTCCSRSTTSWHLPVRCSATHVHLSSGAWQEDAGKRPPYSRPRSPGRSPGWSPPPRAAQPAAAAPTQRCARRSRAGLPVRPPGDTNRPNCTHKSAK